MSEEDVIARHRTALPLPVAYVLFFDLSDNFRVGVYEPQNDHPFATWGELHPDTVIKVHWSFFDCLFPEILVFCHQAHEAWKEGL